MGAWQALLMGTVVYLFIMGTAVYLLIMVQQVIVCRQTAEKCHSVDFHFMTGSVI